MSPFLLLEMRMTNLARAGEALFSKGPATEVEGAKVLPLELHLLPSTLKKPNLSTLKMGPKKLLKEPQ